MDNSSNRPKGVAPPPAWVRVYLTTVEWLAILSTAALLITAVIQVFFRFVLDNSLSWSEELMRYLMIWTAFIGCGIAYSRGEMLGMRFIVNALPLGAQKVIDLISRFAVVAFLAVTAWYGAQFALRTADDHAIALDISMLWVHGAVCVGSVLLAFHVLFHRLFQSLAHREGIDDLKETQP